jgi:hypothetical protein
MGLMIGASAVLLSGCRLLDNPKYRFKMTVEVETPEGVKTGSSVMEIGDWKIHMAAGKRLGGENGTKADLPRADWPMILRFRDINDPKSVEQVDPEAIGVKRIMLETTGDEVTVGIEKRLGWLGALERSSANSIVETSAS